MRNALFLRVIAVVALIVLIVPALFGQSDGTLRYGTPSEIEERDTDREETDAESADSVRFEDRLVIARGLSEYPVTAGDQYRVILQRGGAASEIGFSIPGSYTVNLGPVGTFSADEMTLEELRQQVEELVSRAYPSSFPRLELVSIGLFRVRVTGEIPRSRIEPAWGLTTLSEIVRNVDTAEASMREVTVVSADGQERSYDLFLAQRGKSDENPYVRPGDTIEFQPRRREVSINGEVRFPGTYELLESDALVELVESYAGGLTDLSVRDRIEIQRPTDDGLAQRIDYTDLSERATRLENEDEIRVRSREDFLPAVFFEGAVRGTVVEEERVETSSANQSNQFRYQFLPGETVADAARQSRNRFLTTANLRDAFIERDGERIAVDIASMLYSDEIPPSPDLQRNDRIVIPFRQYFVTVSGAVTNPGQFPYIPDRGYGYYLGLAGGTNPQRHIGENPRIRDVQGNRKRDDAVIKPEDQIFFRSTNPIYHVTPILGVASTILSTIAIFISITP